MLPRPDQASFDAAAQAMQQALGSQNVLLEPTAMADYGDPFAPPGEWYRPGAVLLPGSVEEEQAVLRIANEHGTPVWTSCHLDFMDLVADLYDFNNHAQRRFAETVKDALDPNGILSSGKQGIWPAAHRNGHATLT